MKLRTLLLSTLALSTLLAPAQAKELAKQIPSEVLRNEKNQFITLTTENDLYGSGADENYTNGLRLTYYGVGGEPLALARWIEKLVPTFEINETTSTYYSLGHNLYTPDDITIRAAQPTDRPWAAFLYGSMGLTTANANHVDEVEAVLGVVGPLAFGRQTQEFVHDLIGSDDPSGWDNQLKNEPGVMLSWRRRWPLLWSQEIAGFSLSAEPSINASIGNVYTLAGTGLTFRFSPWEDRWQDTPLRVAPAMAGSGFFHTADDDISWYLFGGVNGRAVARNIFLDGNTFRNGPSVDKEPLVMDLNAGIAFAYDRTRVSYTLVYRTEEFERQQDASIFGAISIGYRF